MAGENELCEEIGSVLLCTEPVFETPLVLFFFSKLGARPTGRSPRPGRV